MTKQTEIESFRMFEVGVADTVRALGHEAVVVRIFDAHVSGRVPVLAVRVDTGAEMIPFADECEVVRKHVGVYRPRRISDDTAERFARFAGVSR